MEPKQKRPSHWRALRQLPEEVGLLIVLTWSVTVHTPFRDPWWAIALWSLAVCVIVVGAVRVALVSRACLRDLDRSGHE